ncbi:MAG: hypothetical protein KDB27_11360 [Planctomycetales bacterium]|nr:hypothetical protein [Planctomycetales bacterium]
MSRRFHSSNSKRQLRVPQNVVSPKRFRHGAALSQRTRGLDKNYKFPFAPPEDWYESEGIEGAQYRVVVQDPGPDFVHVVTEQEVRDRLAELPDEMLEQLEVVQLSRMTRKKRSFPCYGMQWGSTLYLYPIEAGLVEFYGRPPRPAEMNEARMFGGRWVHTDEHDWRLVWTPEAVKDFYLNNILIHELGHLLDDRNSSYTDRERFAEWFAIEYGYKKSERLARRARAPKPVRRRHHAK